MSLWETLHDQHIGLTKAVFKLFLLSWVLSHVRLSMCSLRVESSHSPLVSLKGSSTGLQQSVLEVHLSGAEPQTGEIGVLVGPLDPWVQSLKL